MTKLLHIGFSNVISVEKVVAIIAPDTAIAKRIRDDARQTNQLIDCTNGRKLRSMILTDSPYVFSSAMRPEALLQRFEGKSVDTEESTN
jgi:regulator of extracellular matrix RemA (YlzA/DUF370 family)